MFFLLLFACVAVAVYRLTWCCMPHWMPESVVRYKNKTTTSIHPTNHRSEKVSMHVTTVQVVNSSALVALDIGLLLSEQVQGAA